MKKKILMYIFEIIILNVMFCCAVEAKLMCQYSFKGIDKNLNEDITANLSIYDGSDSTGFRLTYDNGDSNKFFERYRSVENSKLETGENGSKKMKIDLDSSALSDIKSGNCPLYAAYIRYNNWFFGDEDPYLPKVCFSNDQNYCSNNHSEYISMEKQTSTSVKSISCSYDLKDNNDNVCNVKVMVNENLEGVIQYKGESDTEYTILTLSHFICNSTNYKFTITEPSEPWEKIHQINSVYAFFREKSDNMTSCPKLKADQFSNMSNNYEIIIGGKNANVSSGGTGNTSGEPDIQVEPCETIPGPIKEYMLQALKLIRWVGLAAMIVLGVLDFTKAVASDDQDALKKAWGHFIKRLIAVIILFLLPLLIELIFDLVDITTCKID